MSAFVSINITLEFFYETQKSAFETQRNFKILYFGKNFKLIKLFMKNLKNW